MTFRTVGMLSCEGTIIGIESSIQFENSCRLLSIMTMVLASGQVKWSYSVPRPKGFGWPREGCSENESRIGR